MHKIIKRKRFIKYVQNLYEENSTRYTKSQP